MERGELEKTVLHYMENHNTLSLATEKDGKPHAATVFFVNIGFDIYFFSSPTSRHGDNFAHNPWVSATINEDYSDWLNIKGIQLEGFVKDIGGILGNKRVSTAYVKKYPSVIDFFFSPQKLGQAIAQKIAGVNYYRLKPSRIYFINNELGFGHKEELIFT